MGNKGVAAHGGAIRSEYSILYGAVGFIFLVSGLQLSPAKLRLNLTNWRLHLLVQGISFLVIPAIVLGMSLESLKKPSPHSNPQPSSTSPSRPEPLSPTSLQLLSS